jgi:alkyl hydroperoxide reductase subunit AhpC
MFTGVGHAAPHLVADAFVRGERRRTVSLEEFRGSWVVLALGVRHLDVLELSELENAFAADGAIVIAATTDDWYETAARYADGQVRFPILADVAVSRRLTAIIDPRGVVRHVGLRRRAHETLASLEELLPVAQAA